MHRARVGVTVDRDGAQVQFPTRPYDAQSDLAAVRDQHLAETSFELWAVGFGRFRHGGKVLAAFMVAKQSRLLVLDDDPSITQIYDEVLRGEGYEVLTAGSVAQATARMEEAKGDVQV